MERDNILRGYTSQEKSYKVEDYPYGYKLRTNIFYWIESKKDRGDRFCSYTINPKNGKPNKPKYSNYNTFMYMYLNENGYVTPGIINPYHIDEFEAKFNLLLKKIGVEFISEIQQENIREIYSGHLIVSYSYKIDELEGELKTSFIEWSRNKINHTKTCDFKDLVSFPEWELKHF